jgi:hypothetical protein
MGSHIEVDHLPSVVKPSQSWRAFLEKNCLTFWANDHIVPRILEG